MKKLKKEKIDKFLLQFGSVDSFSVFPAANNKIVPVNSGTFDKDLKNADFLKINDFLDLFLSHFGINNNFSNLKEELAKLGPFKESIDTISFFLFSNYIIKLSERVLNFNFSGFETKIYKNDLLKKEIELLASSVSFFDGDRSFHIYFSALMSSFERFFGSEKNFVLDYNFNGVTDVIEREEVSFDSRFKEKGLNASTDLLQSFIDFMLNNFEFKSVISSQSITKNDDSLFFKVYKSNIEKNKNDVLYNDSVYLLDRSDFFSSFFSDAFSALIFELFSNASFFQESIKVNIAQEGKTREFAVDSQDVIKQLYNDKITITETDVKAINTLFLKEEAQKNLEDALAKADKLDNLLKSIDTAPVSGRFKVLQEAFKIVFLMKKNQETSLVELEKIYYHAKKQNSFNAFDPELCNLILMAVYLIFALSYDDGDLTKRMAINSELEKIKKEFSKNEVKKIDGYLNVTQAVNIGWNPQLKMLNNDFTKFYANLYNFITGSKNPYSDFLKDDNYNKMQDSVLKGRKEFLDELNSTGDNSKHIDKLKKYFYEPRDQKNPAEKKKMSIYNVIKNVGLLFSELENPIEFKVYQEGLSFTLDLSAALNNTCLEIASTAILELYMFLFTKKVISYKVGTEEKKLSIADIYFELNTIIRILELASLNGVSNDDLERELKKLKDNKLNPNPANKNSLLYWLDSEGFFALSGFSTLPSSFGKELSTLIGLDYNTLLKPEKIKEYLSKESSSKDSLNNPFSFNAERDCSHSVLFKFIKQKIFYDDTRVCNFYDVNALNGEIAELSDSELVYCFMIENINFIGAENGKGEIVSTALSAYISEFNRSTNEAFSSGKPKIGIKRDVETKYYQFFQQQLVDMDSFYSFAANVLNLSEFKNWKGKLFDSSIKFSAASLENKKAFEILIINSDISPMLDTICRLLPTTNLLQSGFTINLAEPLKKLVAWMDEALAISVSSLKEFTAQYRKEMNESYSLFEYQLLAEKFSARIFAVNSLIDIVVESIPSYTFCSSKGMLKPGDISFDLFQKMKNSFNSKNTSKDNAKEDASGIIEDPNSSSVDKIDENLVKTALSSVLKDKKVSYSTEADSGFKETETHRSGGLLIEGSVTTDVVTVNVDNDFEVIKTIVTNKEKSVLISIPKNTLISDFSDLLRPTKNKDDKKAINQVIASAKIKGIDDFLKSNVVTDPKEINKTLVDFNVGGGIEIANAGHIASIDFNKTNSRQLFDSITDFNYTDFVDYNFTNHKYSIAFKNKAKDGKN